MKNWLTLLLCYLLSNTAFAAPPQSHALIQETAMAFLQAQIKNIPGKVSPQITPLDKRITLPACEPLEAYLPTGAQLIGKTSIGVRCNQKVGWSVLLQADIKVTIDRLVANAPLPQGLVLTAEHFTVQTGEMGQPNTLTTPDQAIGRTLKFAIGAGQVLRLDMLRPLFVVQQGQTVRIKVSTPSFIVSSQGTALNDATEGQAIRIKLSSGQVISAIAMHDGSAEVMQ
ncbi:MAG: flagellar basal body P-ring formation chaperone FlgA [Sideroxydans sp.]|nr:flagellar basal body P-ring formation chaperone FlgA [Sideroxydans sp.]